MRNVLGCCFSKEGAGPGCVGQAWEECEGAEMQSAMAIVCHIPKRRWLGMGGGWGKNTQAAFDGKHWGLPGPHAVDGVV